VSETLIVFVPIELNKEDKDVPEPVLGVPSVFDQLYVPLPPVTLKVTASPITGVGLLGVH
jgi:hypothetical protein